MEHNENANGKNVGTISDSPKMKTLVFTCPRCGSHTLQQFDRNPFYWTCEVSVCIEGEDLETAQIDEESEPRYERLGDLEPELAWFCGDCEMGLTHEDGRPIEDEDSLAEWLWANRD
jgi:hypothetical protein